MSGSEPEFLGARPNLHVRDVMRAVDFYGDVFGFEAVAVMGKPPSFALLRQGGAEIALVLDPDANPTGCYLYVTGVEALHDHCVAAGVPITYPLTLEPWGLLNFVIADPDGHGIAIGEQKTARHS